MKTELTELKPCPFCNGKPFVERAGNFKASMIIACENCGCRMESGDVAGLTPIKAYTWNTRHQSPVLPQLVEALKAVKKSMESGSAFVENWKGHGSGVHITQLDVISEALTAATQIDA